MSEINYQALREAAEAIKIVATPQKLLAFRMKVTPQVVLELLDERERNQQYIKRRDQENEDIALTVGKLRVELEAAKKRIAELEAEPVSQTYKLPPLSSNEVNDAAWKLHNMLTEHGPLNGRQFNNLKGCFYEALKVAMRNYPVNPDGWISCSERMPDKLIPVMVMYEDGEMWSAMWNGNRWDDGTEYPDPHSVTHWREMPAAPQQEVK
ncbi:TPA: DUF551 domain-containing protein [Escherichia coli]|nr:DUF551 domain-containing protein [Escherichia coli]